MALQTAEVIIVIPGTMGSRLCDDEGNLWPGDPADWIKGYQKLQRLKAPALRVGDILRDVSAFGVTILEIYGHLIETLEDCGFKEQDSPPTLYVCPYDWRLSVVETVETLAAVVARAHADHGDSVGITLISHSLGGLLGRFFLESGDFNKRPGYDQVRQLIFMGVPHLGLPLMLTLARGDRDYLFLSDEQLKEILNHDGLPFVYLMLPAGTSRNIWETGGPLPWTPLDITLSSSAGPVGLSSSANLSAAATYHERLDKGTRPAHVRYFSFVGTRQKTLVGLIVNNDAEPWTVDPIERPDGGDGTVPDWSAWLAGAQGLAVGGSHSEIFKDRALRSALTMLLGCTSPRAKRSMDEPQLDISDPVLRPGQPATLSFSSPVPLDHYSGRLTYFVTKLHTDNRFLPPSEVAAQTLSYHGAPTERIQLLITAPEEPGGYRVVLELCDPSPGIKCSTVETRFVVQQRPQPVA